MKPRVIGKDFNFYRLVPVSQTTTFAEESDVTLTFTPTELTFHSYGTGGTAVVEYSFNGNTVHGELDPSKNSGFLLFKNRVVSGIWFRVKSGSTGPISVRVESWGT